MRHPSLTFLATCLLIGALVSTGHAQPPPPPDTTKAATQVDSSAAPAPTVTSAPAPADSMAKAQSADSLTAAPEAVPAAVPASTVAPAASTAAPPPPPPTTVPAQATPAAATPPPPSAIAAAPAPAPAPAQQKKKPIYFGGTVGFTFFGDVTRFYVQPTIGYKLTPKLSVGGKLGYEHLKYDNVQGDNTSDNWGASVFARLKILPMLYGHAEYAVWRYDTGNDHTSVPYMLLGGGYIKPLGPKMALTIEALVDVLQDDKSPYNNWEPWVTVGIQVGF